MLEFIAESIEDQSEPNQNQMQMFLDLKKLLRAKLKQYNIEASNSSSEQVSPMITVQ